MTMKLVPGNPQNKQFANDQIYSATLTSGAQANDNKSELNNQEEEIQQR